MNSTTRRGHVRAALLAAALLATGLPAATSASADPASATSTTSATSTAATAAGACTTMGTSVLQVARPFPGPTLDTRWPSEALSARDRYGYTENRGVVFDAAGAAATGLTPVHRAYRASPPDFVDVLRGAQLDAARAAGYVDQGVAYHASPTWSDGCVAVHRFLKNTYHRLAADPAVRAQLVAAGWQDEGVVFWAAAPPTTAGAAFTIAVLPDTQEETSRGPDWGRFAQRMRWLAANRSSLGLAFVGGSGDVTNWGWLAPEQLRVASDAMREVEAVGVPYALSLGNHDTRAVGWNGVPGSTEYGGSAYQNNPECQTRFPATECVSWRLVRRTQEFNGVFTASRYRNVSGAFEPGKVDNVYSTFTAGGRRWLVLTLEVWPRPEVVSWAARVVEDNPDRNVVIQTHAYLDADGSIGQSNGGYGATSPQYLFDTVVSRYPNVKLVLSGHVGGAASRTDRGVAGNTVYTLMQSMHDRQGNPVRLVTINPSAGTIEAKIYSPWSNTWFGQYAVAWRGVVLV
jgi:hypothetical protein